MTNLNLSNGVQAKLNIKGNTIALVFANSQTEITCYTNDYDIETLLIGNINKVDRDMVRNEINLLLS